MHKLLFCLLMLSTVALANSPAPEPLVLWPKEVPGGKGDVAPEADITKPEDTLIAGRRIIKLGNVSNPTLTVYKPAKEIDTGAAVLVCPGGGYYILAMDLEGTEVCEWLNSIGVTGLLLKYRVPSREPVKDFPPLQDAQRAMGLARQHAAEWGINPDKIGVLGFSAGGHLAASLSTNYQERRYAEIDAADKLSCRPDFTVLVYPGGLVEDGNLNKVPDNLPVDGKTAPTFIVQTGDDFIPIEHPLNYYKALRAAKVPAEMHIYAKGGHGYGLRPTQDPVTLWPKLVEAWLRNLNMLK